MAAKGLNHTYDSEEFRSQGHELIDILADYLREAVSRSEMPVLRDVEPDDLVDEFSFDNPANNDLPLILAGFSFGAVVQSRLSASAQPKHLLLVGPAVNLFQMGTAPAHTLVIHGECDELVPIDQVRAWTTQHGVTLAVVRDADHFFHKKLSELKQHILELCPC